MNRQPLSDRRGSETVEVRFRSPGNGNVETYLISIGPSVEDPKEIFVHACGKTRPGSVMLDMMRETAVLVSKMLQAGCALEELRVSMTREPDGLPSTPIGAVIDAMCKLAGVRA